MRRSVLLVLFLVGCAGPQHDTLQRGAPVRVAPVERAPTYTPNGTGLPEYWGSPAQPERSPHARVLPQTPETRREPGIWAAKSGAPVAYTPSGFAFEGVSLPAASPDAMDTFPAKQCSEWLRDAGAAAPRDLDRLHAFHPPEKACAVAKAFFWCIAEFAAVFEAAKVRGDLYDATKHDALARTMRASAAFVDDACKGVLPNDDVDMAWTGLGLAVRQRIHRGSK